MRIAITAMVAAAAGLIAAGMLGVATAEAPTVPPLRTLSVEGVSTEAIDQSASAVTAKAVYRQGMADAVTDGQSKAQFLASKAGATLGAVQSVVEGGGYIGCAGNVEYQGEQPDFGSPAVSTPAAGVSAGAATPRRAPVVRKPAVRRRKHRNSPSAKKASVSGCTLSAQISLVYALS